MKTQKQDFLQAYIFRTEYGVRVEIPPLRSFVASVGMTKVFVIYLTILP